MASRARGLDGRNCRWAFLTKLPLRWTRPEEKFWKDYIITVDNLTLIVTSWKIIIYINFVQNFRNNLSKLVYFSMKEIVNEHFSKNFFMKDNYFQNNLLKLVYFPMEEIVNEHFSQNVCFDEPGLKRNFGKITKSQWSTYLTLYVTSWKIIIYINFVQNFWNNLSKLVYFPKFSDERNCQ